MKVIKLESDSLEYVNIFKLIQSNGYQLTLWQVMPNGERNIYESSLNSYHSDKEELNFKNSSVFKIDSNLPLYCYSPEGQCIFKSDIIDTNGGELISRFPRQISFIQEEDVTLIKGSIGIDLSSILKVKRLDPNKNNDEDDLLKVKSMKDRTNRDQEFLNSEFNPIDLDEEDKLFAGVREAPRARPKIDKWVKVVSNISNEVETLRLFDLSQGGISFVSTEIHLFPKGSKIEVVGFNEFDLDDPLMAEVMSQRAIDATQIEYKIGCKFNEGQS